jgi:hypothetical protein
VTIYVDDANIPATVRNGSRSHTSAWCHLTADTQDELHEFAARLGLKRSYFQPGRPLGGKPSPFWHYDLTAGKRAQAVALGAREVSARELPAICRAREAAPVPVVAAHGSEPASPAQEPGPRRQARRRPDNPCPDCQTAELTSGRGTCQACGLLASTGPAPERTFPDLSHGQPGHMCVLSGAAPQREAEAGL